MSKIRHGFTRTSDLLDRKIFHIKVEIFFCLSTVNFFFFEMNNENVICQISSGLDEICKITG
jgi:hypothetical protein